MVVVGAARDVTDCPLPWDETVTPAQVDISRIYLGIHIYRLALAACTLDSRVVEIERVGLRHKANSSFRLHTPLISTVAPEGPRGPLGSAGVRRSSPESAGVRRGPPGSAGVRRNPRKSAGVRGSPPEFAGVRWGPPEVDSLHKCAVVTPPH
eukprot:3999834-Prymnesium_polylepis.2